MARKERIICLVSNDLNQDQRMQRICTALSDAYEVVLLGRKLPDSAPLQKQVFTQKRLRLFFKKGKFFYLELFVRQLIFLLSNRVKLVYTVDLDTILAAMALKKVKGTPFVYDAHEYFVEVPELIGRKKEQAIWERLATRCIPEAEFCITVSRKLTEILTKRYGNSFHLIRNMPLKRPYPVKKKEGIDLIYQGALNKGRGLELIIESMQWVEKQLLICGRGDVELDLKQLVKAKGLEEKVIFTGNLLPEELYQFTCSAKLGFNLLEDQGLNYKYSLANKFFDYVQAGIPQICINFPEYAYLNAQFKVAELVDLTDAKSIAKAINEILNNDDLLEEMKENCKLAAQEWNWEKEKEQLQELFKHV